MSSENDDENLPDLPLMGLGYKDFKKMCEDVPQETIKDLAKALDKIVQRVNVLEADSKKAISSRSKSEYLIAEFTDIKEELEGLIKKHGEGAFMGPIKFLHAMASLNITLEQMSLAKENMKN